MKLDAETLRKLALSGAKAQLRTLEVEADRIREIVRQLSGASVPAERKPRIDAHKAEARAKEKKPRKNRKYTDKFRASVVKEAREADNASAVGKKHNVSPSLVRLWMDKAK